MTNTSQFIFYLHSIAHGCLGMTTQQLPHKTLQARGWHWDFPAFLCLPADDAVSIYCTPGFSELFLKALGLLLTVCSTPLTQVQATHSICWDLLSTRAGRRA